MPRARAGAITSVITERAETPGRRVEIFKGRNAEIFKGAANFDQRLLCLPDFNPDGNTLDLRGLRAFFLSTTFTWYYPSNSTK